jgi:hypothetical protein
MLLNEEIKPGAGTYQSYCDFRRQRRLVRILCDRSLWFRSSLRLRIMEIDTDKVDEAVLALLYLTLHDGARSWKGFDWESLNRLHANGLISNPEKFTEFGATCSGCDPSRR